MLTVSERDSDVLGALSSGASGYVLKGVSGSELLGIVRSIAQGGCYISPALATRVLSSVPLLSSSSELSSLARAAEALKTK